MNYPSGGRQKPPAALRAEEGQRPAASCSFVRQDDWPQAPQTGNSLPGTDAAAGYSLPGAVSILITREPGMEDLPLPSYATDGAAGMDLRAAINGEIVLVPGARALVPTGIRIALPEGTEAQIRPRSGLALHHGVTLLNSPGTIDSDYRGVVCVIMINLGHKAYTVMRGDRVAQMVVAPVLRVVWQETNALPDAVRGDGGFGHTGTN